MLRSVKLLIVFGINRNCLNSRRSLSLYPFIRRLIKVAVVIIDACHFYHLCKKFYPTFCFKGKLHMQGNHRGLSVWISV